MSKNEGNQKLKFFKPSDLAWNARSNTEIYGLVFKYRKGGHFSGEDRAYKRTVLPKGGRLVT